jgi:Nif-specific regulatory protein/two-component system response regulator HydG
VFGVLYLDRSKGGAFTEEARGFVADLAELAGSTLHRASELEAMRRRVHDLERDLFARYDFTGIVTRDPKMTALLRLVAQIADSDATVLVRGETGTGKELIARALHMNSARAKRPFVALHTTALPGTVLESELFGHVRGAFTGADRERAGRIASAHGGTLFLDEVAEIPLDIQAKLLRFAQFGEIQRLGSDKKEEVDVRLIAATHQDLGALVAAGKFRQDLYFRLKVIELVIPPLRARRGDIALLLDHFISRYWRRKKGEGPTLTPRARERLDAYGWPGNVRELENLVERVALLATSDTVDVDLFPEELGQAADPPSDEGFSRFDHAELEAAREVAVQGVERRFLDGLLSKHGGNVSQAARDSNINRTYLQRLIARHRGA